ncbi:hypothetical protein Pan258_23120 [Symmachiella dynata]|uniref:hypothetical protein n=1 Tax=Symmachiella dynata TaxID=2527995 RepID=UPI00118C5F72|nr:hypothetical protein [Symmachiella dynata]QDT48271.1 hypothetical protein Pan258_23120 [Symmachiella dynata]
MKKPSDQISHGHSRSIPRTFILATAGIAILGVCATVSLVAQDETTTPAEVPEELQAALVPLDNNWKQWSDEVGAEIAALYAADKGDTAALRQHVKTLNSRMAVVKQALADPAYRSIEAPLRNLYGQLGRRLSIIDAALDTLELTPEARTARLDSLGKSVTSALNALATQLKEIKNGESWLVYLNGPKIRASLKAGGPEAATVLADVGKRFATAEASDDATVRDFVSGGKFQSLKAAAENYVEYSANPNTTANADSTGDDLLALFQSLDAYEAQPDSGAAAKIREAHNRLRAGTIDGGARIEEALRANYFNFNVRVIASEPFVNKFVAEARQENGPVRDFILGAQVSGSQVTATDVSFDFKPDPTRVRFNIKLAGRINSNTQGVTDQATIFTHGTHYFWANKPVLFDGDLFYTENADIAVNANNQTVGASTNFSGIPILGGIADNIAVGEAQKRKGQSEAIARGRVSSRVIPRLNSETDARFIAANADMDEKVDKPLRELGLFPDAKSFRTTEDDVTIEARLMKSGELGAGSPYAVSAPANGALIQLHETWINNSVDRLDLAGKTMNEDELKTLFETRLKKLLGDDFKFPEPKKGEDDYEEDESGPATLIFADQDPIRIQVSNNLLIIRIRAGIQREDDDDIPTQEITIEVKFTVEGDSIQIEREGGIRVVPVESPDSRLKQLGFASAMRGIFQRATPPRTVKRQRDVQFEDKQVPLNISNVEALDGWVTIEVN